MWIFIVFFPSSSRCTFFKIFSGKRDGCGCVAHLIVLDKTTVSSKNHSDAGNAAAVAATPAAAAAAAAADVNDDDLII